jgi:hypothetical protein
MRYAFQGQLPTGGYQQNVFRGVIQRNLQGQKVLDFDRNANAGGDGFDVFEFSLDTSAQTAQAVWTDLTAELTRQGLAGTGAWASMTPPLDANGDRVSPILRWPS